MVCMRIKQRRHVTTRKYQERSALQCRLQGLASTSSPLTWMIGQLSAFATSVQYGELRLFLGSVVKATCTHTHIMSGSVNAEEFVPLEPPSALEKASHCALGKKMFVKTA